jgi:hypothetical protein
VSDPIQDLEKEVVKALHKAGAMCVSELRTNLNNAQPYQKYGSRFVGLDPSKPGDFPKKLSGQLLKSVAYSVDEQELSVTTGTAIEHGKFLELGTSRMQPRPWLFRTVQGLYPKIAGLFAT